MPQPAIARPINISFRLTLALAVLLASGACDSRSESAIRKAITAEMQKGTHAVQNKDLDEYLRQVADEVLPKDSADARRTRDAIRHSISEAWKSIEQTRSISIRMDSLQAMGDSAIVVSTLHWDRIVFPTPDQKTRDTVISDVVHREIWRRTPAGWRSFKVISFAGTTSVNGKVSRIAQ